MSETSYVCAKCKTNGTGEMSMVPGCNHYFCFECSNTPALKIQKGSTCPAPRSTGRGECGQPINNLVSIFVPTGVEDILENVRQQIGEMENEKALLKNVKDGVVSFTRNLINASSLLIERNVRFLQSDQEEKSKLIKEGQDFAQKAVLKINELVSRAERMKRGQVQKNAANLANLQRGILDVSNVTGAFETKLTFTGNSNYTATKNKLYISEPNQYGTFFAAVHTDNNPLLGHENFFPPTYLPSDYFTTHLVPPYMEYVFVIPNFFAAANKHPNSIISPTFQTRPFPFRWRFLVYPRGSGQVPQNSSFVSAHIELVNGSEPGIAMEFRKLFPEYAQSEDFPDFSFTPSTSPPPSSSSSSSSSSSTSSSSSSLSSTSPSAPFDPSTVNAESTAALMRNPFVFDYKIQIVAQKPSAEAKQRVYTYESTANFQRVAPEKQGKSDFILKKDVDAGFVWSADHKYPNGVHFVFGIRFPSFKREYEALRVAYELPEDKY